MFCDCSRFRFSIRIILSIIYVALSTLQFTYCVRFSSLAVPHIQKHKDVDIDSMDLEFACL